MTRYNQLSEAEKHFLRSLARDDDAYHALLQFFDQKLTIQDAILDEMPIPLLITDAQADEMPIVFANRAWEAHTGYKEDEVIGQNLNFMQSAVPASVNKIANKTVHEAITKEQSATLTMLNTRADKQAFWNKLSLYPVKDKSGRVTHFASLYHDISDTYEQQLAGQVHSLLMDNGRDMIAINTPEGDFVHANALYTQTVGYSLEELFSLNPQVLIHPDDLAFTHQKWLQMLSGETVMNVEYRLQAKDGTTIWIESSTTLVRNPEIDADHVLSVIRDISEKKRRREEAFRTLVENNTDSIKRVTPDGKFVYVNQATADGWGIPVEAFIGKTHADLGVPEHVLELFHQTLEEVITTRKEKSIQFSLSFDTDVRTFQARVVPELNHRDEVQTILSISRDITDIMQAEHDIKRSEKQLRQAQEIGGFGSWELVLSTKEMLWSEMLYSIFGLDPQTTDPSVSLCMQLVHPDDRALWQNAMEHTIETGEPYKVEKRIIRADGSVRWVETRGELIRDPFTDEETVAGTTLDITDYKDVQRALQRSEARYQSILSTMVEGVVMRDANGQIMLVNDAALDILGVTREAIQNNTATLEQLQPRLESGTPVTFDDYPAIRTLKTGDPNDNKIVGFKRKGELRWVLINTRPMETEHGIYGVVSTFSDITDQQQRQQDKLRSALEAERVKILADFVQNASHEFRTPLAVIQSNLYLLSRTDDDVMQATRRQKIRNKVQQLNDLVDVLLLLTKLDSEVDLARTQHKLKSVIDDVLIKWNDHQDQIHVTITPPDIAVNIEIGYFRIALTHLLENAIRYNRDPIQVTVNAYQSGTETVIEITDNGDGIDATHIDHIFERFWRLDTAHTDIGFGLGLSIARRVAHLHQGDVSVTSDPGIGSTFTLKIG